MNNIFDSLKTKYTKRIILPIMIIMLCFIAVIGSTYAIFTNGSDGKIGINATSGQIKLDILDAGDDSLVGKTLDFILTADDDGIFYFEPGATVRTQGFKVKNYGNITVNYRIYISEDPNENMDAFYDAFELWITNDPTDLSGAVKITNYEGVLIPGETTEMYYLVIKMKDSAGNDFQGKEYSGIGITVYAVQGNVDIQ